MIAQLDLNTMMSLAGLFMLAYLLGAAIKWVIDRTRPPLI